MSLSIAECLWLISHASSAVLFLSPLYFLSLPLHFSETSLAALLSA